MPDQHIFPTTPRMKWAVIGFAASLIIPSVWLPQKYVGNIGVVVYVLAVSLGLLFCKKHVLAKLVSNMTNQQTLWLTIAAFLILLTILLAGYPVANSNSPNSGSDRDEALNIATTALLQGHYPYYDKTYLGNPISALPGSLILAVPFVLLGNSAYQNLFWLFVFFIAMSAYLKDRRFALCLLDMIILFSPVVLHEYVTGGDLLANSLYVLLFVIWTTHVIPQTSVSDWKKVLLATLLGIGLASRANFILLLPLVFSALGQQVGWRTATKYLAITCLTFALITIPFYLYNPQGFSPLTTANKLGQFQAILPFSGTIVPLFALVLTLLLSFYSKNSIMPVLLRNCALILALPVLCGTVLKSIFVGNLDLSFTNYGLSFLFFGAVAFFPSLYETQAHPVK